MINKKICQLALGILPISLYAEICCPVMPDAPLEDDQVCSGYYYPALYETSGCYDIILDAEFIYWAPDKQLNSYAVEHNIVGTTIENHVLTHDFGYHPGFKIGAGIGLPCFDNMSLNAEYLWFNHTTTSRRTASPGDFITLLPGITLPDPFPQPISSRVTSKWHVNHQMADFTLGRAFYLGQRMILSANMGIRGVWFDQSQSVDYDLIAGGLATTRNTLKAWALGPALKLNAKGLFCGGFYALGKTGVFFLYHRFTKNDFSSDFPFTIPYQRNSFLGSKKPYLFPTYLETGLGFGWAKYFCGNSFHVDLALTYDYFVALMLFNVVVGGNLSKDFYMHGLTLKAQLDF